MKFRFVGLALNAAAVFVALALIWLPEISAFRVDPEPIDATDLTRARSQPGDAVLAEISRQQLGLPVRAAVLSRRHAEDVLARADAILAGRTQFFGQPSVDIAFPFEASNLDKGPPTHQLYMAGLGTVDVLLQAFRVSGKESYFAAATEELRAFGRVDRRSLVPRGLLWNDHALANSVRVIADFWSVARRRPDFGDEAAREVLGLASRTAERLAKPGLFTYRTNHGVMQNVALLQFAAAFPWYRKAAAFSELACRRLDAQMKYYVSPEGPILEHSAGYHEFGRELLEAALHLAERNGCVAPNEWREKMRKVVAFSATLRRPDGTLPVFGNTDYAQNIGSAVNGASTRPGGSLNLFPVSGFAVRWDGLDNWPEAGSLAQTVVTWSDFPSRAHKLADDLAVVIWARGYSWLANTGYWPYGREGFDSAHSWRGSNAPHFAGESARVARETNLRGFGSAGRAFAIDVERRLQGDSTSMRRQLVAVDGASWVIVDSVETERAESVERIWTSLPEFDVQRIGRAEFLLLPRGKSLAARLSLVGDLAEDPASYRGSRDPFAGWVVRDGQPAPAPAVAVRQRGNGSMVFTVLQVGEPSELARQPSPRIVDRAGPERWKLVLGEDERPLVVARDGASVTAESADASKSRVTLTTVDVRAEKERITRAYFESEQEYPRFRELAPYRYRVTYLAIVLLLGQEMLMLASRRIGRALALSMRFLAAASWILFGLLASYWYLQ